MTNRERRIAEAALEAETAVNAGQLASHLATKLNLNEIEVKDTLDRLVGEGTLRARATPSSNIGAGDSPDTIQSLFYEKGPEWE